MKAKILSIIIPVYNVEKYIARCLDSIYNQNFDESYFDVIAVNDGSPDNSLKILERYKEIHQNLLIHTKENGGLSSARNKGLELAKGRYVWFVDSDDWITDDSLKTIFETIEKGYDVISTTLIYSYDDERKNRPERFIKYDKMVSPDDYILNYSLGASQRYIIRKAFLDKHKIQFYPGIYHEDGEFGPRLIAPCDKVYILAKPVYYYYQRESGSIMSSWKVKNSKDAIFISQKTLEYANSISNSKVRDSVIYSAFRTLMFAFGSNKCKDNKEIFHLYNETKPLIRKMAYNAMFAHGIGCKKRILVLVSIISPDLYYKLKK